MACCLMAQNHFLNQCCIIISDGKFTGEAENIYPILKIYKSMLQSFFPEAHELMSASLILLTSTVE